MMWYKWLHSKAGLLVLAFFFLLWVSFLATSASSKFWFLTRCTSIYPNYWQCVKCITSSCWNWYSVCFFIWFYCTSSTHTHMLSSHRLGFILKILFIFRMSVYHFQILFLLFFSMFCFVFGRLLEKFEKKNITKSKIFVCFFFISCFCVCKTRNVLDGLKPKFYTF